VTSWDELEAYLSNLVEKVGGTSYILQGSGGRHLAPRPPAGATLVEAIERWLREQRKGDAPAAEAAGVAELYAAPEVRTFFALLERSKQVAAALDAAVGADFVKRGPGKRYVHRQADLPFIAERFLSAYLLILAFSDAAAVDEGGAVFGLERARSVISALLEDLPPDGGGDRALSIAKRLA
jgi:hypothetical protein